MKIVEMEEVEATAEKLSTLVAYLGKYIHGEKKNNDEDNPCSGDTILSRITKRCKEDHAKFKGGGAPIMVPRDLFISHNQRVAADAKKGRDH